MGTEYSLKRRCFHLLFFDRGRRQIALLSLWPSHGRSPPAGGLRPRPPLFKKFFLSMIPIEELLEAGVHFGHRVNKWNPKMAPYIFGERNGVHIIDLIQTLGYLEESYLFLSKYKGGATPGSLSDSSGIGQKVLFVGTKKQVAAIIQNEAQKSHSNYVNHRWLGGLLTNWTTIKLCIAKLKTLRASGLFEEREELGGGTSVAEVHPRLSPPRSSRDIRPVATKKEKALLKKQYEKLKKFFAGIENMSEIPDIVIIVGQDCEMNAVKECHKLSSSWRAELRKLPEQASSKSYSESKGGTSAIGMTMSSRADSQLPRTITILDTNCDPSLADLFIPANDDSTKSIELILNKLGEAIRIPR